MWGVLVSKTPRRAVGTVLSVLPDAARNTQEGHQGKEGRRTSVINVLFRLLCCCTCILTRAIRTSLGSVLLFLTKAC